MMRRAAFVSAAALLGGAGAAGAAASVALRMPRAVASYSVALRVPRFTETAKATFRATGTAKARSLLRVYIAQRCVATPNAEAGVSGPKPGASAWRIIDRYVSRSFSAARTYLVGATGEHRVCAYLTRGAIVEARASGSYTALTAGY